ncbi:HNH endonuclease [Achromobacter xylosoxidans]|uniref:HNH endonuclease n=1 Tax=Alcaligenes xylosoxydans xylosoxydans TaxID=85698 RepID=UPI0006BFD405|nr:HNH endonuclease [Achromobacter xylosoxidans]CUI97176.1 Uncharacterised protein [Achromobacter xylosoxidans]
MLCIVCRKDKEDMSDEHVIPDSLGGFYHIYSVCKPCNSELGEKVDSPLVNHKLTELYRFAQEIEGKTGKVPNPFSGIFAEKENPEATARLDVNKEGKIEPFYHPKTTVVEKDGVVEAIEISVDSKDEEKIDGILKKILKRKGIPESAVVKGERRREIRTGGLGGKWEIDILKFRIGLLKIAYEFAVDSIPAYLNDPDAIQISKILKNADYEAVRKYVRIGSGLEPEIFKPFEDYLDLSSHKHYLVLVPDKRGLLCLVKLDSLFTIGVVLSNRPILEFTELLIGVNDIEEKSFRKLTVLDLSKECMGPTYSNFGYYFATEAEKLKGQAEFGSPGYRYEGDGRPDTPLYRRNGLRYSITLEKLLKKSASEIRKEGKWHIERFTFNPNRGYFVKATNSGHLYQVIGFEMSQEVVKQV